MWAYCADKRGFDFFCFENQTSIVRLKSLRHKNILNILGNQREGGHFEGAQIALF